MKKPVYIFCFLFTPLFAFPQQSKIDSLLSILKIAKEDTDKVTTLNKLSEQLWRTGNYDTAFIHAENAKRLAQKINFKKGIATAYSNIGNVYYEQGNYPEALKNHFASLKIREEIGDKQGIAGSYNNIGIIYDRQGNYPEALKNYFASLKIKEEIGDKKGIAMSYNNIGCIYSDQGKAHPNPSQREGLYNEALKNHFASLKIREEIGDKRGIASSYINIGSVELKLNNTAEAKKCLQNALSLSKEIGSKDRIKDSYSGLAETDSVQGNYKSAYQNYKMYILYRDSLLNEENTKKTVQTQMQYEFDKKESLAKAEQEKKDAIANEEKRKQKIVIWSVIVILLLVVVFSVFMFNRWRVTQKQKKVIEVQKTEVEKSKELIEEQKKLVEEKNKDITDSINYAQRIQRALLASDSLLAPALKGEFAQDYFILFKPKDIVSGDFYWATKVLPNGEDLGGASRFYLAVCDSTGHGVPGAFMSLLNISFLNEAITEKGMVQPNEIFNHVRQRLIENISQDGGKDGMDGILISFKSQAPSPKSQGNSQIEIAYAAAHNAPILVRNGELLELEADKMPVGAGDNKDSFTHYSIEHQPSNINHQTLYLYTDGFADQFGGPKGKKFKYKQLNEKLLAISHLTLAEQKKELEKTFEEWKGNLEQIDDVLVIGIKI